MKYVTALAVVTTLIAFCFVAWITTPREQAAGVTTVLPIAGSTYSLSGSGVSGSATSITLTSLTIPQTGQKINDADVSDTFYVTLEPGSKTRQEIVSCTTVTQNANNTATLSGCSRGLSPITPYTASTTLQFAHAGGTTAIFSDPPQLFNQFLAKGNDGTVSGVYTFSGATSTFSHGLLVGYNCDTLSANLALCPKAYVDSVAVAGASNANDTTKGIVETATAAEAAAGTSVGGTGARLAIGANLTSTTCSGTIVPVTTVGKLSQGCFDLTASWTYSGGLWSSASTTIAASNVTTNALTLNGIPYKFPGSQSASSTVLATDGSGALSWNNYNRVLKHITTANTSVNGATTTLQTVAIPANTLTTTSSLRVSAMFTGAATINCGFEVHYGSGAATTTLGFTEIDNAVAPGFITGMIMATSTTAQMSFFNGTNLATPNLPVNHPTTGQFYYVGSYTPYNLAAVTYLVIAARTNGGTCTLNSGTVEVLAQ